MLKISRVVIISILIVTQLPLWAQNNTNSPYTRFGYGELADRSFGAGRAMGGVGYGLRSSNQINPLNPASYNAMDSMTFLFDFGANLQFSKFDDGLNKQNNTNGNVEYIALQFPVAKRIAVSLGILPYSYVGYDFGSQITDGDAPYIEHFLGTGGLNDLYGGVSIDIWKKRLAVGANIGYFFGNINHQRNTYFGSGDGSKNVVDTARIEVRDMKFDFGVQYTHPLSANKRITVGAVYSPANKLNTKVYNSQMVGSDYKVDTLRGVHFDIPHSFGLGVSYVKDHKLTLAADFLYEAWDKAKFFDRDDDLKNRIRIGGGVEYIPSYEKRNYFNRVKYRAGAHYSDSYQKVNDVSALGKNGLSYKEYGASIGLGLPLIDNRSYLNMSFEYVKIKPETKLMIDEQYFRLTVNFTFNERWFYKFKVN